MRPSNFKKNLLATNIALLLSGAFAGSVYAAEPSQDENVDNIEKIEVRGMRASLKASVNEKRFSNSVVDAVTAEDIGKFPDGDIGESLGRIPGVSVNRQFGQGSQVSIRGASSRLTRTLLNGHSVASTGWYDQQEIDRSFNYSLLPPEMVGGIIVHKSSTADMPEGGVGGTVIVETRKPLDLDPNTLFLSAKADYGSISEETDPELSGLYSWANEEQNFGFLVSAAGSKTNYQRNGIESLLGWGDIVPTTFEQERERTAVNAVFQYSPTDNLSMGLNLMSLDMEANNANTSLFVMFPDDKDAACEQRNASGTCTFYRRDGQGQNPGWAQTWARQASMDSKTVDFDIEYEGDNFTIEARVGNTKSEGGTDLTANYGFWLGSPEDYAGTYDATGDVIHIDVANKNFTSDDFGGQLSPAGWSLKKQPNSDEETYAQFDITVPVDFGAITSIKTGVRYTDHDVKQETFPAELAANITAKDASAYYSGQVSSGAGYTLPKPDLDAMLADAYAAVDGFSSDGAVYKSGYGTINEKNLALYAMANFDLEGIRGNFGLRYISTDAESDYFALQADGSYGDNLSTDKASYNDVLPSINIAFDITQDVIVRASASQVISRPNYADMFSSSSLVGYADGTAGNEVLNTGNVGLLPYKASQADLGVEWYFSNDGLFGATYFIKDISSFVTTDQILDQGIGIVDPDSGEDSWTVSTRTNGTGGIIKGVELQLQDAFDNGLGYAANYTFAESDAPAENYPDLVNVFSDSSKHTVNLVGFYEMDDFSARIAYNWRSEYMIRELPFFYGNREHDAYGTLDLSANYNITDYLAVTFEVMNLLEEDSIQKGVATADAEVKPELKDSYPAWSFEGEARYTAGITLRF
ncbi:TonB-dependent receptor [Shewanella intestini]|uniref:TonB-dependent receptor n=1 Tax=Shewanella intestini TaxID=2017544 RepID=A0ABS5HYB2_9GAMM|nr:MULTISPECIES: TonB-dependent receptor [Shewanella]MBR9726702.1 TonB-dependent receptor [Shewanella intestini]MRG34732.1 TonB-dependent receptor [Shewanella sp. XMDDZSB0408]